jgi:hypothetical protein
MAEGVSDRLWEMAEIVALVDAAQPVPKPRVHIIAGGQLLGRKIKLRQYPRAGGICP